MNYRKQTMEMRQAFDAMAQVGFGSRAEVIANVPSEEDLALLESSFVSELAAEPSWK